MFQILFTQRAIKDLTNIDSDTKSRLASKLKEYAAEPMKYARKLSDPKIGTYRFRIGDYRVIFDIDKEIIVVLRVGHRKDIYK
ncbi:MAG: type II toxin-antitoxin system RelE/ParE family toxin [candidate division WOR-3 bacterium]